MKNEALHSPGIQRAFINIFFAGQTGKNEPSLWHDDRLFRVIKQLLASILDFEFTKFLL
jgi:hypothetical protein